MGFLILPLVVLCAFLGLSAIQHTQSTAALTPTVVVQAQLAGQAFIAYRNAVIAFQHQNPTFTGQVPDASLQSVGGPFPVAFLASAGNAITSFGASGRVVTAYASLPVGAVAAASEISEGDASLGIVTATKWKSFTPGATPMPLAAPAPDGAVVSVTQTGN